MDIKVLNLSAGYNQKTVLENLSLTFKEGSVTAVMGPSGVGKTTLLMIISGLKTPESGIITGTRNAKVSMVFQENRLCEDLSALLNIKMVLSDNGKTADKRIKAALSEVGIDPDDRKPVSGYSGGMQRRVAIVRALLADFDVLLLDEPFTGLDEATMKLTADFIKKHSKGKTVILVTHSDEEAAIMGANVINLK